LWPALIAVPELSGTDVLVKPDDYRGAARSNAVYVQSNGLLVGRHVPNIYDPAAVWYVRQL